MTLIHILLIWIKKKLCNSGDRDNDGTKTEKRDKERK